MSKVKKIKILPGGPYEVDADIPLNQAIIETDERGAGENWGKGKEYPKAEEPYHLCRCGHSKNKPYCDGSHTSCQFNDEEVADNVPYDKAAKRYVGETVDLLDNENLCAVARFCDVGEQVWNYAMESGKPGYEEEAIRQACNCPAGRLVIQRKNGEKIEPDLPQEISAVQDPAKGHRGPLWVKGGITLEGQDGKTYEVRNRMTLCRCGQSNNMPFCDASHLMCNHMRGQDE